VGHNFEHANGKIIVHLSNFIPFLPQFKLIK
jgi:hypothetical protein